MWLDLSALNFASLGDVYETYQPDTKQPNLVNVYPANAVFDKFLINFSLSRSQFKSKWTVKSLNLVLGQIGGYTALLWMVITFVMTGFEGHKYTNSLISKIYVSTPSGPDAEPCASK